ncbi:hypothetical protein BCR44DRAFT_1503788 [Catenaria anguillulae PL171]|uniref:Uncharacterized protein n=1 Tax=Catenaria anguillulae PL171 TaxID=765915 RepID=A0A1Y2H8W2_9FUNG|nr:hypothetical protein BCR44DRAFT_1503788 [Catenaria anguillulae PL171]
MTVILDPPPALGLLDLPEDVFRVVLSRRFLPPSALVEVACVSKASAAVALPELFTNLLIPSIATLPLIHSTLKAHPEHAQHVRSLTASRYLALSYRLDTHEPAIQKCRPYPDSPIISLDDAVAHLGPEQPFLDQLPMPWLVRIAQLCPHLSIVDWSYMDEFNAMCAYLTLGLGPLADILRERRGRFHCRSWPLTCVLVKDRCVTPEDYQSGNVRFEHDVYFVDSVDWGRRQVDVTDFGCSRASIGKDFCLVPFRRLVPLDEQASWSIGHALLRNSANKFDLINSGRWITSSWLKSKDNLWHNAGLAHGEDRVFDFSQAPTLVKGKITLGLPMIDLLDLLPDSFCALTHQHCTELIFDGADPGIAAATPDADKRPVIVTMIRILSTIANRPLEFVTALRFTSAYFVDESTAGSFMHVLAQGAPNLEQLDVLNTPCPPDYVLYHADALVRRYRFPGKLLQKLSVSTYVPDPADHVPSPTLSSPSGWKLAETHMPRSPPVRCLTTLELELTGPGVDSIDSRTAAKVAIHPDILRQLTSLTLQSVQLYLPPPHLAHPHSPSFMPLAHIDTRPYVPLTHAFTLPNLTQLNVTSNALPQNHIMPPKQRTSAAAATAATTATPGSPAMSKPTTPATVLPALCLGTDLMPDATDDLDDDSEMLATINALTAKRARARAQKAAAVLAKLNDRRAANERASRVEERVRREVGETDKMLAVVQESMAKLAESGARRT